ncbi:MAG: SpoIIE family protein phosphatase [Solirubrobacteraceae bacterium MAG38_C4-C5]|nr:SpoIIE family protein phosphatase [Candidatus Siliceabacter maunaloa]
MDEPERARSLPDVQSLLSAVLEQLPVGVIVAEVPGGRMILGNEQVAAVMRHPFIASAEVEGYAAYRGLHPDGRPYRGEDWPLARTVATGETVEREEIRYQRGDDTHGVMRVSSAPVHDGDGVPVLAVAMIEDVTERARLADQLALLAEAGDALSASLDPDTVVDTVARLLVPRVADYWALDLLRDDGSLQRVGSAHAEPGKEHLAFEIASAHPLEVRIPEGRGAVLRTGEPQLVARYDDAFLSAISRDAEHAAALRAVGLHSAVYLPLKVRGRVTGAMLLGRTARTPEAYEQVDVGPLEEIARRCAMALANATSYERERTTAEQLQRSLLPDCLPALQCGEARVRYLPGGVGMEVGGDWYDVLALPGGRVGLVIGDVVGRGTPAAVVMGHLRSGLRAYAMEGGRPDEVIGRLNTLEHTLGTTPSLATLVYAIYEPARGLLSYTAAGHPAPLVRRACGQVEALPACQGMPLGVRADLRWEIASVALGPGDTLVLYTDGLVERRGASLDAVLQRVLAALGDAAAADLDGLCDAILAAADTVGDDDVALLAFRADPPVAARLLG